MAHIDEIAPVIIDPGHDRFGQVGEMTFSGASGDGTCLIQFDDGETMDFNDGWVTGITQFVALRKAESDQVSRLVSALPELKPQLAYLFEQVVDPYKQPPAPETAAALIGTRALINSVIMPPEAIEQ